LAGLEEVRMPDPRRRNTRRQVQPQADRQRAWDEAKAVAAEWEKAGSWDGEVTMVEPPPEPTQPHRADIERAVTAFLAELQETAAFATHKKYRLLLTKFNEFSTQRGYTMIDRGSRPISWISARRGRLTRRPALAAWRC
jgi:hypothetical protein